MTALGQHRPRSAGGAGAPAAEAARPPGFDRRLIAPMILGSILNPINSSIIAVSLVPIGRAFGAPSSQTAWLVSALYLATAVGQPVVGRLVDTQGPRRLFLVGTALTGLAGLIGALAPQFWVLVLARVILGFGTCAGYPAAMYLIRHEGERTGMQSPAGVLTALAVASQTIAVIGPTLGGLLIGVGGWRTTFALNIPLAIFAFALAARRLPSVSPSGGDRGGPEASPPGVDVQGIALFAVMLTSLLLFLMRPHTDRAFLLGLTAAAGAGFVMRERRARQPFIDVRVLGGNAALMMTYLRALITQLIGYAFLYGYTQWLEDGRHLSATQTGLVLLPMFGTAIAVSTTTGRDPRIQAKLVVAATAQALACGLLLAFSGGTSVTLLIVLSVVLGLPQGLASLGNQNAVYFQAEPARIASSAGLLRTFGYLGAIGASSAGGLFFGRTAGTSGLHHLGLFMLVAALVLAAVTVADRSLRQVGAALAPTP